MSAHTCHATGCDKVVKPSMLMCAPHWRMVHSDLQRAVWRTYVPGQERRKDPSPDYLKAARAAINCVARAEGKPETAGLEALG